MFSTIKSDTKNITLIAVSKTRDATEILDIHTQGVQHFGENYVQEALPKIKKLRNTAIIWHFIGPIQSNKTSDIADNFDVVHSVDRIKIAARLNNRCLMTHKTLKILLQINVDSEVTKSGIKVAELLNFVDKIKHFKNIKLIGLMCIPAKNNSQNAFKKMQALAQKFKLKELSMGMSADYKIAIENGTTMVRIGTAIFGARK